MDRGLVISSCGVRLVYEVGILRGMLDFRKNDENAWRHIYGSSGGAVLASFLCMYKIGDEERAIRDMEKLIGEFYGENGMKNFFPFGMFQGLLWNKSLFNSSFLERIVNENINLEKIKNSGRKLNIIAVDYETAQPRVFTEKDIEVLKDAIIGSCSIQLVYPPKGIKDCTSPTGVRYYGDGGITDFCPIKRALENPSIGNLDVIISVGEKENRVLNTSRNGEYPGLIQIVSTMTEAFYRGVADEMETIIAHVNMLVKTKKMLQITPNYLQDLPEQEKKRIMEECLRLERDSYVQCLIFRPLAPIFLSAMGVEASVSKELYSIGINSAKETLALKLGKGKINRISYI